MVYNNDSENGYCVTCTSTDHMSQLPAGIPLYELDVGLAFVVLCLFVGGLVPTRFVYKSITDKPKSILDNVPALVGRVSCLGLGSTIAAETVTGKVRMTVAPKFHALSSKSSWKPPKTKTSAHVGLPLTFAPMIICRASWGCSTCRRAQIRFPRLSSQRCSLHCFLSPISRA